MILMLISLVTLSLTGVTFYGVTTYQAIDNTFLTMNYSLPPLWIINNPEKTNKPLYDTKIVEESVINHFSNNLKKYVNHYDVGFYYFNAETFEETSERYVSGVRLSLSVNLSFTIPYYKAMTYIIKENQHA